MYSFHCDINQGMQSKQNDILLFFVGAFITLWGYFFKAYAICLSVRVTTQEELGHLYLPLSKCMLLVNHIVIFTTIICICTCYVNGVVVLPLQYELYCSVLT